MKRKDSFATIAVRRGNTRPTTSGQGGRQQWFLAIILCCFGMGLGLTSCSTTAHLPEGEVLYTGISDINFGDKGKKLKKKESDGIITAIRDGYDAVEGFITGDPNYRKPLDLDDLTKQELDSLKADQALVEAASDAAQEEVEAVLSIAPNNSLLGSAKYRFPLPIGLWVYNRYVGSGSRFGKWMFNTFSATPKLISTVNPGLRSKVAQNVLHNFGYFRGEVNYEVQPQKNPRKAKVAYSITPHQLYRLDKIEYQRFPPQADSLIRSAMKQTLLHTGDAFTAASLAAERERLNTLFRNRGYFYCQPTFFTYRADTLQRSGWVQLQVRPSQELPDAAGRPFRLRHTTIHLVDRTFGTHETHIIRNDSLTMLYGSKNGKPAVRYNVLRRHIFYRKGSLYRQRMVDVVQERLSSLGIFSQVNMNFTPIDTTATCDMLDVDLHCVLDKAYDAEFKANASTKSNGLVGPGLSFGMTKRNAFRGAEALTFQVYGSYEWQTGSNQGGNSGVMNSYEYGTSLSLEYPYIKLGRLASKLMQRAQTSTSFKLEANWLNRAAYFGRVSLGARVDLTYRRKRTVKHEFTPFRLNYDLQLHSTATFDSIVGENQALYVSMRNQFVPAMQYTLSMASRRNARNPRTFTLSLKEAGNVTSGIYACFGRSFSEKDKNLFGVPFAQYLKAVAEYTEKFKLGHSKAYLATRVQLGSVYSYGNATIAPYSDLLTIGGANSIRAFAIRSIGPGSYHPSNSKYSYVDQVGDLKFETNVECRFPIVGNLGGAVFLDCGNVWLVNNNKDYPGGSFKFRNLGKELALGTGCGLRYDLDFIVVRFDLGVGIHAPYDTGRSGYYNMTRFGKSLGYHLAIGYPF